MKWPEVLIFIVLVLMVTFSAWLLGWKMQHAYIHSLPVMQCEIENDLPRSQTCEMVAVVKETE